MVRAFLKANEIRQKRRVEEINSTAHLQGLYVYEAIGRLSPVLHAFAKKGTKPKPYLKDPFQLSGDEKGDDETEEEKEKREKQEALRARLYMDNMIRAGKNWGNGR